MKRAYLFFAGELKNYDFVKNFIGDDTHIYGADGGANHIYELGLNPLLLVGDFDSISKIAYDKFKKESKLISYPPNKNFSDGELLIRSIYDDYDELIIFSALGGRYDHTFFNVYLLEVYPKCKIINEEEELFFINKEHVFYNEEKARTSFLPLCTNNQISLYGFEYPLDKEAVKRGDSLTLSNVISEKVAKVEVHKGGFICIKELNSN